MRGSYALLAALLVLAAGCNNAPTPATTDTNPPQPSATPAQPNPAQGSKPTQPSIEPDVVHPPRPHESRSKDLGQNVAAWHKSLPSGLIHHYVKETMELARPSEVKVTIDGPDATPKVQAEGTVTDKLQVSPRMVVELTQPDNPDGFKIDPAQTQPPKLIASDGSATWTWMVTPQHLGKLKLHIAAYVLYEDDPNNELSYATYDSPVTVHSVTVKHESRSGWEWIQTHPGQTLEYVLPGGTGAIIIGKLIDVWRKRKKKPADSPTDEHSPDNKTS